MFVSPVPCLSDNYAYLVVDEVARLAAIVDPGEAPPVEEVLAMALEHGRIRLAAIWTTHHHPDHVGGVAALVAAHPDVEVVAHEHDRERTPHVTRTVDDGDTIELGDVRAKIIHNPGHTLGAITYVVDDCCAFTGDTLFGAGCGRVFEGTPAMMHASLTRLAALPPGMRVYFGHEYTANNLRFAAAVEPENAQIAARTAKLRPESTPSTIADERATNPFLRSDAPAVIAAARARGAAGDPVSVFGAIRAWKDAFR